MFDLAYHGYRQTLHQQELSKLIDEKNALRKNYNNLQDRYDDLETLQNVTEIHRSNYAKLFRTTFNVAIAMQSTLSAVTQNNPVLHDLSENAISIIEGARKGHTILLGEGEFKGMHPRASDLENIYNNSSELLKASNKHLPKSSKLVTVDYDDAKAQQAHIEKLKAEHAALAKTISTLEAKLSKSEADLASSRTEFSGARSELTKTRADLSNLQASTVVKDGIIASLDQTVVKYRAHTSKWSSERHIAKGVYDGFTKHPWLTGSPILYQYCRNVYKDVPESALEKVLNISEAKTIYYRGLIAKVEAVAYDIVKGENGLGAGGAYDYIKEFNQNELKEYVDKSGEDGFKSLKFTQIFVEKLLEKKVYKKVPDFMDFETIIRKIASESENPLQLLTDYEELYQALYTPITADKRVIVRGSADYILTAEEVVSDLKSELERKLNPVDNRDNDRVVHSGADILDGADADLIDEQGGTKLLTFKEKKHKK